MSLFTPSAGPDGAATLFPLDGSDEARPARRKRRAASSTPPCRPSAPPSRPEPRGRDAGRFADDAEPWDGLS